MDKESKTLPRSMELEVEEVMRDVRNRFDKLKKPKDRIGEWVFTYEDDGFVEFEVARGNEDIDGQTRHLFYCHFLPEQIEETSPWLVIAVYVAWTQGRLREALTVACMAQDGRKVCYRAELQNRKKRPPKLGKWKRGKTDGAYFEIMTDIFNGDPPCRSSS